MAPLYDYDHDCRNSKRNRAEPSIIKLIAALLVSRVYAKVLDIDVPMKFKVMVRLQRGKGNRGWKLDK
jgi:hypothetical protein